MNSSSCIKFNHLLQLCFCWTHAESAATRAARGVSSHKTSGRMQNFGVELRSHGYGRLLFLTGIFSLIRKKLDFVIDLVLFPFAAS